MNHAPVIALYGALARGDRNAVARLLHPDFRAEFAEGLPFGIGGTHLGLDAIDHGWWAIGRAFALEAQPQDYIDTTDGRLLVLSRYVGEARSSGRPVDAAFGHLWAAADDRLIALIQMTDTARWMSALAPSF